MVFGNWPSGSTERAEIPKRGETNEVSPMIFPGYCLEMFPGCSAGKRNPGEVWGSPKLRSWSLETEEAILKTV